MTDKFSSRYAHETGRAKRHFRLGLVGSFALLVVFIFAADKAFLVFQQQAMTRKAAEELLLLEADSIKERVRGMEKAAEQLLDLLQRWTKHKKINFTDVPSTNALLMSYMQEHPFITSVNYGDSQGNGYLLLWQEGRWLNRIKKKSSPGFVTWHEVNADGTLLSSEKRQDDYDPRTRLWYIQGENGMEASWSAPYVFRTTRDPGITASLRVSPVGANLVGVVGVDVMLQDLSSLLAAIKRKNPDLAIAISLPDESLLAASEETIFKYHLHKDSDRLPRLSDDGFFDMQEVFSAFKKSPTDFITVRSLGRNLYAQRVRFDFSEDISADLLLTMPQQAMLRRFQSVNIPWFTFATVFLILLCIVFVRHYLRPVQQLTTAMRLFGTEGYDRPEFKKRNDEIGLLAKEFTRMTDELSAERRRLISSEERYSILFESVRDGIYSINQDNCFTKVNQACAMIFGFDSPSELLGRKATDFWLDLDARQDFMDTLAREKSVQAYPVTIKRIDGKIVYLEASSIYLENAEGHYLGVEGILRDITRTVLQSRALALAVQEWRSTFDAITDYVSIHDHEQRIVKVNRAMAEFFGGEAEQLIGKRCYEIYQSDMQVCRECPFQLTMLTKGPATQEVTDTRSKTPLLITTYPILDARQEIVGCVHVARDLSEQKSLEAQLLQAQKMEAIGRLAGGIAHDFNNMLSVIIGYGEMVLYSMPADSPYHEQIKEIVNAGRRSADLTRQLLAFARKQPIQPRVLDLNDTIYSRTKMIGRLIGEDIVLRLHLGANLWQIYLDPAQLDQIMVNLAVNSRDAIGDKHGEIIIETANVEFDAEKHPPPKGGRPGRYVTMVFSDNGCGMAPEVARRIFEPFFTTKEQGKGTGLGLAVIFGIVTQNNGFVVAETAAGEGAQFKFFFPLFEEQDAPAAGKDHAPEGELPGGSETVLLVEDEEGVRLFVQKFLGDMGYAVLSADNPRKAIAVAERHQGAIDLLLSDVVMPDMNGKELWEILQSKRQVSRCIFMSGYPEAMISDRGLLGTGVNYIQKPFSRQELAMKIRAVLGGANSGSPV